MEEVKTKKVVRRKLNIKRTFLLILFCVLFSFSLIYIKDIKIKGVDVVGNKYSTSSDIIKRSNIDNNSSLLFLNRKRICKKVLENNYIEECKISIESNLKVKIKVKEAKPLLYYKTNEEIVLSNLKTVKENNIYGIPTLVNYTPSDILNEFTSLLKDIDSDIIHAISEIEYAPSANSEGIFIDKGRFILSMNDSNTVYTNIRHLNVLNYYKKIISRISDKKGIYYLDCDYNNYYFTEY